jgi:3-phenylpropionate/trans-cinnamate dioxygenase ferredoxin reductase component
MQEERTLERGFGERAGSFVQELLEEHGVTVHGSDELERFEGEGRVAKVVTRGGLELAAEAVVIGAGVSPDIQLAQKAGLEIGERGGVRCSSGLQSTAEGVFAAGDICEYDSPMLADRRSRGSTIGGHVRIEHWDVAFNQGKTAALNMLCRDVAHETVPYFYSVLGDWGELEYVGPAYEWDEEIVRGSYENGEFTNWYLKDGRVRAALTFGRSDDLEHARRLIVGGVALDERRRSALGDVDSDLGDVK